MSQITQRQINMAVMVMLFITSLIGLVYGFFDNFDITTMLASVSGMATVGILLGAYWRGWEPARHTLVVLITILTLTTAEGRFLHEIFSISIFIPMVLALVLTSPLWIIGSSLFLYSSLLIRAGGGIYADPLSIVIVFAIVGGMALGRLSLDLTIARLAESRTRVEEALTSAETARALAETHVAELGRQNATQQELLELVSALETPAIGLADGIVLAPIVGRIDSRRAQALTERLLQTASARRVRRIILDISGVTIVDTGVAQSLIKMTQALRLLGCTVTITGISAEVAATLTQLGVYLGGVEVARSPQEVLLARTA